GTGTRLNVGDALLFIGDERKNDSKNENWDFRRVAALETVSYPPTEGLNAGYTIVTLDRGLGSIIPVTHPTQKNPEVYALRQRASLFGYNAIDWNSLPADTKSSYPGGNVSPTPTEWPNFTLFPSTATRKTLDLDMVYPKIIAAKSWLVLCIPDYEEIYRIKNAVESARAEFGLSGKTTLLTLGAGENFDKFEKAIRTA